MKIVFEPSKSKTNKYADILVSILKSNGYEVYGLTYWFKHPALWFKVKVIHLNWFENIIGRSKVGLVVNFLKQTGKLVFIRLVGGKVIWTMHNKTEHERTQNGLHLSNCLSRIMMRHSHYILIHCDVSRNILIQEYGISPHKIMFCPHPNYIDRYGPVMEDDRSAPQKRKFQLLFLGAIRPYKNIELLIETFQETDIQDACLTIAGMPLNKKYEEQLRSKANGDKNIQLQFQFIEDHKIPLLLALSDAVILPYEQRSSLNSGTIFLAFSYQKTVISPEIGTVLDLQASKKLIFHYSYNSPEMHKRVLKRKIEEAYSLFVREPQKLSGYGRKLYEYVDKMHGEREVFRALHKVYTG